MHPDYASIFTAGDMTVRYPIDPQTGRVGLEIFPTALADQLVPRRTLLRGTPHLPHPKPETTARAWQTESLVQVKLVGDPYPGVFAQGHTMRHSPALDHYRYQDQRRETSGGRTTVTTTLATGDGLRLEHRLSWYENDAAFEIRSVFHNGSGRSVKLEMLSSFTLGGITPFHPEDAPERLRAHRFRSVWSAEGRHEVVPLEDLHLERSWSGTAIHSERFGQVGTMPVRKFFPFVAIEDTAAGVCWGAQLAWAGSWQMEICRQYDDVNISGGLADREFGHWMKTLAPGEWLETPPATVSCVRGDIDDLCDRLTAVQHRAADQHPAIEQDMPIIFNEWCTTWGNPRHDQLVAIARRLKESPTRYLVIDAGWYKSADYPGHGDWIPSRELFPDGLDATAAAIRAEGLIPGLWYEMETVSVDSRAGQELTSSMLQRDGQPVTVTDRHFWDLNDAQAIAHLNERVIRQLRDCGFGYLKVDYNETLGLGSEHPDGLGEGLRQQILGTYRFWDHLRAELPDLVIENCASGGHRLEPSMLGRSAMSSFSDAHEIVEIPIVAAALHRLMLPRQSQIWAVLRPSDTDRRLAYSLAATFLGRMCLSGDIEKLTEVQWEVALRAQRLYQSVRGIIKHGRSRLYSGMGPSWRHPRGYQALVRQADLTGEVLVIIHTFADSPERFEVPLPRDADWTIADAFTVETARAEVSGHRLIFNNPGDFTGAVFHVTKA